MDNAQVALFQSKNHKKRRRLGTVFGVLFRSGEIKIFLFIYPFFIYYFRLRVVRYRDRLYEKTTIIWGRKQKTGLQRSKVVVFTGQPDKVGPNSHALLPFFLSLKQRTFFSLSSFVFSQCHVSRQRTRLDGRPVGPTRTAVNFCNIYFFNVFCFLFFFQFLFSGLFLYNSVFFSSSGPRQLDTCHEDNVKIIIISPRAL